MITALDRLHAVTHADTFQAKVVSSAGLGNQQQNATRTYVESDELKNLFLPQDRIDLTETANQYTPKAEDLLPPEKNDSLPVRKDSSVDLTEVPDQGTPDIFEDSLHQIRSASKYRAHLDLMESKTNLFNIKHGLVV